MVYRSLACLAVLNSNRRSGKRIEIKLFVLGRMFAFLPFMTIVFMVSTIAGSFKYSSDGNSPMGDDVEEELKECLAWGV